MIVVVTPNPAIDVTYRVDHVEIGNDYRVKPDLRPGGKGFNVARVLTQLGERCTMVTIRGGGDGELLAELLTRHEPSLAASTRWVEIGGTTRRTVAVVDDVGATLFNEGGPSVSEAEWSRLIEETRALLTPGDVLVVSGSTPAGSPTDIAARLVLAAREADAMSLVDTSGPGLLAAANAGATLLKPNIKELTTALTAGTAVPPSEAIARLLAGGVEHLAVSAGADGMVAFDEESAGILVRAPERIQGNATGAGDASVAALARALATGQSTGAAIRDAVALSAAAVLAPVAGEVDLDAYHRFLPMTSIEPLTKEEFDAFG